MSDVKIYIVSDYNPKYLGCPIESFISGILSKVVNEDSKISEFELSVDDKVTGLPHNSAKIVTTAGFVTEYNEKKLVEIIGSKVQNQVNDSAVYNLELSASHY